MSTQLLSTPGKQHELSDDLESHFFVLLYEGLHFVKHNIPGIPLGEIFDQHYFDSKTGNHTGGRGKASFYTVTSDYLIMTKGLEFTSEPFTILLRKLYQLFSSLYDYHTAKAKGFEVSKPQSVQKLDGCAGVEALFEEALKSGGWPVKCDKVLDQYPPADSLKAEQRDSVALSYLKKSTVAEPSSESAVAESSGESAVVESSGVKRKRGTEGEIRRTDGNKRSKVSQQH